MARGESSATLALTQIEISRTTPSL
jgi:hypothetical protein